MFITFEGLDGSGKTTQFHRVVSWLRERGCDVLPLREPGGTRIGERIRDVLHDSAHTEMDSRTELLLYAASRAQIVSERINPHLQAGGLVLCDRYADSTMAYQGYGRGLDIGFLQSLVQFATRGLQPDLTLYLDIEPEVGIRRRIIGNEEINRLDAEKIEFHRKVQQGYRALIAAEPQRWVVVDANLPIDALTAEIQRVLTPYLQSLPAKA